MITYEYLTDKADELSISMQRVVESLDYLPLTLLIGTADRYELLNIHRYLEESNISLDEFPENIRKQISSHQKNSGDPVCYLGVLGSVKIKEKTIEIESGQKMETAILIDLLTDDGIKYTRLLPYTKLEDSDGTETVEFLDEYVEVNEGGHDNLLNKILQVSRVLH